MSLVYDSICSIAYTIHWRASHWRHASAPWGRNLYAIIDHLFRLICGHTSLLPQGASTHKQSNSLFITSRWSSARTRWLQDCLCTLMVMTEWTWLFAVAGKVLGKLLLRRISVCLERPNIHKSIENNIFSQRFWFNMHLLSIYIASESSNAISLYL